jgi:pantetheine-phosphate adenylyltransferase
MKRIAVYPGTFDPITNGHLDIIKRAMNIYDLVYVAVNINPPKATLFNANERINMIKKVIKDNKKIKVEGFSGLLVNYVKSKKALSIIRGLRAVSDFDYEFQMALTNRRLNKNIETVFMMTDYKYSYLSSTLLKQLASLKGDITGLVPKEAIDALKSKC